METHPDECADMSAHEIKYNNLSAIGRFVAGSSLCYACAYAKSCYKCPIVADMGVKCTFGYTTGNLSPFSIFANRNGASVKTRIEAAKDIKNANWIY